MEMTLKAWVETLPKMHRVRLEYLELLSHQDDKAAKLRGRKAGLLEGVERADTLRSAGIEGYQPAYRAGYDRAMEYLADELKRLAEEC